MGADDTIVTTPTLERAAPPSAPASYLESCTTLTGRPLTEAFASLDRVLPPAAYKAISGGTGEKIGLTDIVPGFLPAVLLDTFGPMGTGWGFEVKHLECSEAERRWNAYARVAVWYAYHVPQTTEPRRAEALEVPGASDNSRREWAEKGAITNALGTAWFFMGYQVSVFQGLRSHEDAGVFAAPELLKELAKVLADTLKLTKSGERLAWCSGMLGRKVASRHDLSHTDATDLLEAAKNGEVPR
jgi:hypothetical protein